MDSLTASYGFVIRLNSCVGLAILAGGLPYPTSGTDERVRLRWPNRTGRASIWTVSQNFTPSGASSWVSQAPSFQTSRLRRGDWLRIARRGSRRDSISPGNITTRQVFWIDE